MIDTKTEFGQLQASVEATRARALELRATSFALQQRLLETQRELAEVSKQTQATLKVVRQHLELLRTGSVDQNRPQPKPSNAVLIAMSLLGLDESDLDVMTDNLIAALRTASEVGDDDGCALFGEALMVIGRHLAAQIGPKAAGVVMN